LFAGHAEHAFTDDVRCHLGRAAADANRLAHQKVDAPLGEVAIVIDPRSAGAAGELEGSDILRVAMPWLTRRLSASRTS
jgi:hypothetical protein